VRAKRRERHFDALRSRWLLRVLHQLIPWSVAAGYRMGRATTESGRYQPIRPIEIEKLLNAAPGYDRKMARGK
jgi:hypothetical protein